MRVWTKVWTGVWTREWMRVWMRVWRGREASSIHTWSVHPSLGSSFVAAAYPLPELREEAHIPVRYKMLTHAFGW